MTRSPPISVSFALAIAFIALTTLARPALAQTTGLCCSPTGTTDCFSLTTPYACNLAGGVFYPAGEACSGSCDPLAGIGMSRTAARRLVREGVVHTLWVRNPDQVYGQPFHDLWDFAGAGTVIAPQIPIDLRHFDYRNPEAAAQAVMSAAIAALVA